CIFKSCVKYTSLKVLIIDQQSSFVNLKYYYIDCMYLYFFFFFFSSRRRHTRSKRDWSSDVCSSDLAPHASMGYSIVTRIAPAFSPASAAPHSRASRSASRGRLVTDRLPIRDRCGVLQELHQRW